MAYRLTLPILVALLLPFGPAIAAYPERPIELIVAYSAGATNDTARALAPVLARELGNGARVEVVNIPGAGGENGFAALAAARPDGHTLGFINVPVVATIPAERRAKYSIEQLDPLARVVSDPCVWSARADAPFTNMSELAVYAASHPETVSVATTGVGSDDHLALARVRRLTGLRLVHVPFTGSEAATRAVLDGKVLVVAQNLVEALETRAREPLRILGVMNPERLSVAPDVPTFRERGIDVSMRSTRGVAAPRGLPAEIRATLIRALSTAVADPEFVRNAALDPTTRFPLDVSDDRTFAEEVSVAAAGYRALWAESPWIE